MQHDVLFSYLTTKEHLLLYGSIKVPHWTKKQLHEEVKRSVTAGMRTALVIPLKDCRLWSRHL